ncbi:hypothetical protein SERLADRAFT_360031 [Serpula lacrymans var. lacrymans S7.9]|uniref:Uncharacterized protein n=1 Tax=Serpula lacrymans var. lacrymans (strain S7.9) TaxID=578457 RepID=F8NPE7_SERL9|nr:uncharacterized protein SERLADRAFT_360031 [Serpula lacrymans var. lacrymans S7.9]EGO27157.1 hypothetical protein SERLADRAFT_360031 [Serpula lacrymans var. lacrymans S7.9]
MLVLLAVMSGVEVAIMATLVGITISRIEMLPVVSTATGCYYSGVLPLSALFWTPVLVVEPLLLGFVLFKAARTLYARGTIFTALARESLLYFLAIFAQLLIATIIWARFPTYLNVVMPYVSPWSAALPSLLGNRLLINMRQRFLSERSDTHTNDIELASIVFSRFPFLSSRAPGAHTAHTAHTAQPDAAAPDDPRRD